MSDAPAPMRLAGSAVVDGRGLAISMTLSVDRPGLALVCDAQGQPLQPQIQAIAPDAALVWFGQLRVPDGCSDNLLSALRAAKWNERDPIKAELLARATGPEGAGVRDYLENARRGELLEVQWEIEEVLEATTPKKEAPAAPVKPVEEAVPEDPNRPLTAKDLAIVYEDPRGLILHKSKVGDRWFATQQDPRTGQPQTFELHAQEIAQLKTQLANSPYWVLGAGVHAKPAAPKPSPLAMKPPPPKGR